MYFFLLSKLFLFFSGIGTKVRLVVGGDNRFDKNIVYVIELIIISLGMIINQEFGSIKGLKIKINASYWHHSRESFMNIALIAQILFSQVYWFIFSKVQTNKYWIIYGCFESNGNFLPSFTYPAVAYLLNLLQFVKPSNLLQIMRGIQILKFILNYKESFGINKTIVAVKMKPLDSLISSKTNCDTLTFLVIELVY